MLKQAQDGQGTDQLGLAHFFVIGFVFGHFMQMPKQHQHPDRHQQQDGQQDVQKPIGIQNVPVHAKRFMQKIALRLGLVVHMKQHQSPPPIAL
jgi:hypothetical protein